jgi:hypothetical protein
MKEKVVYEDSMRRVTKAVVQSEGNTHAPIRYSKCDNKYCRREAHYYISGIIRGWDLHVCRKHMKTMTPETVKPRFTKWNLEDISDTINRVLAAAYK